MASEKPDRRLYAIFLIVLIDVLGMTIILPLLPFYSEHFGASPVVVGMLVSAYAICQLISGPILGHMSDRIGRKPVLIFSQIGTLIGFIVLAFANSLSIVFLARIIDGLTAGNLSTAQAYISDIASPKDRAKSLGKISMAFGIGFFVGPALTAFLYHYGYKAPICAATFLSFCSIMASTFLLPATQKTSSPAVKETAVKAAAPRLELSTFSKYFKNPVLSRLLIEIGLFYFAFSCFMSGFALFAERRFEYAGQALTPKQVGFIFTYFGFLQIIVQGFLMGRLVEKFGERKLALFGFASSGFGYLLLSFIHGPFWIGITGLFSSFGGGVLRPVLISEISGSADPRERGTVMGVTQSLQSIAQIIAPLVSTLLIQHLDLAYWARVPATVALIGFVMVIWHRKKHCS